MGEGNRPPRRGLLSGIIPGPLAPRENFAESWSPADKDNKVTSFQKVSHLTGLPVCPVSRALIAFGTSPGLFRSHPALREANRCDIYSPPCGFG